MQEFPALAVPDVEEWVGEQSLKRGRPYARNGSVRYPHREGLTLRALVQGTAAHPYRVTVTLGKQGIRNAECSCPVGDDGRCKHVAAPLLTWLDRPETFAEAESEEAALQRLSKDELIALVRRIERRFPEVQQLISLEVPILTSKSADDVPVDADAIRRQVTAALEGGEDQWDGGFAFDEDLAPLVEIGDTYREKGAWRNAATVYQTVAQTVLDHYELVSDEDGTAAVAVNDCVERLGICLASARDEALRENIVRAVFAVYRWDNEFGGIGVGDAAPEILVEQTTPAEKRLVAELVRAAMPTGSASGDNWYVQYRRRDYGALLLQLAGGDLDDDTFLSICKETGQTRELVERLLRLGRLDDAVAEAQAASDYDLLALADVFVAHHHGDVAENLVRRRLRTSDDPRLAVWLKDRARTEGDVEGALELAERLFWRQPSAHGYQEIGDLSRELGTWEAVRAGIRAHLTKDGQYALLTEIALLDGEVDAALAALDHVQHREVGWHIGWVAAPGLALRVARAAEETRPADSIRLYLRQAEKLIQLQGRSNYAEAAAYLKRVRDLYRRQNDEPAWRNYITKLREDNRRLRALQDEMNKAGLL